MYEIGARKIVISHVQRQRFLSTYLNQDAFGVKEKYMFGNLFLSH